MRSTRREAVAALLAAMAYTAAASQEELDTILEPLDFKPLPTARNIPAAVKNFWAAPWLTSAIATDSGRKYRCLLCGETVTAYHALTISVDANRTRIGTCWTRITDAILESGLGVRLK